MDRDQQQLEKHPLPKSSVENFMKPVKLLGDTVRLVMQVNWTKLGISTMEYACFCFE